MNPPSTEAPIEVAATLRQTLLARAAEGRITRILAVRFARLGDLLFTSPALRILHAALPDASIDYLTTGYCRDVVASHPAVSRVLEFDRRWHRPGFRHRRNQLISEIEKAHYDLAVVFEANGKTRRMIAAMLADAGVPHVISRSTFEGPILGDSTEHACERHMALLSMLGIVPDDAGYELHFSSESAAGAAALLEEHGVRSDQERPRLIGIQAGCHYSMWPSWLFWNQRYKYHKTWPQERWVELGQALHDELDARLVITGAGAERRIAENVARGIRARQGLEPINAAGRTRVGELAALLSKLDLFISIDTGSMHMSSALGVPTVALFGPTDPGRHGPYAPRTATRLVTSGAACSPCKKSVRKACPANVCMTGISVDSVVAAARELLTGV